MGKKIDGGSWTQVKREGYHRQAGPGPCLTMPPFSPSISRWHSTESTWTQVLSGQKTKMTFRICASNKNFFCNCKKHDASYILFISVYLLEKSNNRQKMGKGVLVTPFLKRRQKVVQRAELTRTKFFASWSANPVWWMVPSNSIYGFYDQRHDDKKQGLFIYTAVNVPSCQ